MRRQKAIVYLLLPTGFGFSFYFFSPLFGFDKVSLWDAAVSGAIFAAVAGLVYNVLNRISR